MKKYRKTLLFLCSSILIPAVLICAGKTKKIEKEEDFSMPIPAIPTEQMTETSFPADSVSFYHEPVSKELQAYMTGKSYKENSQITFEQLRHVVVQYHDFEGYTQTGELIVSASAADDVVAIFQELYDSSYPIEKIRLVDEYGGDDDASMADNNTSCFNYRTIDGTDVLSDHSLGLAIDINPLYNPYVRTNTENRSILPVNAIPYADRSADFPHKITTEDICYQIFTAHGWEWGGNWDSPVDYQHFYKNIRN